jgi:exodeoxyribonuclease V alpha subunit
VEVVQGVLDRVTYRSPETSYTVLRLTPERGFGDPQGMFAGERITAVGPAPEVGEGLRVRLAGTWDVHPQHGRQFRFETLSVLRPLDRAGIVRYLSSSTFRGVGPTLAERIVETLGGNALTRIREDPPELGSVKGLRADVRTDLVTTVRSELGSQETLAFLYGVGLGPVQAELVLRAHGPDSEAKLRADPYLLARGITGIGFHIADRVAQALGIEPDAPERRRAALLHELREAAGDGHVLQSLTALAGRASALIEVEQDADAWQADAQQLAREGEIVIDAETRPDEELVYLAAYHTAETRLAANLAALVDAGPVLPLADAARLERAERETAMELHPEQRAAVLGLLREPVALLTGGPGVGKTTIVRLVVELAEAAAARVRLASPTGRAAKRLAEATGRDASTVHRLLGWEPGTGRFAHGDRQPLEADLVVVDEISMLDLALAHHLVKAVQPPTRLVLVGDPDQLPSVSAGNVLADLLASGRVPAFRLSHIYRQAAESLIVANAHRILAGEMPQLPGRDELSDFFFFGTDDEEHAADRLIEVVTQRIPQRFGRDWVREVQVLSPMYKGPCGVDALNERLREAQGIGGRELRNRGRIWRVGDRVIHTRNDYEKGVFNGDMGRLEHIDADGAGLTVRFPEREVRYTRNELGDLRPAFAITVHRSQGGEFPVVVLPLVDRHANMLQRNLLYTAVTRAKDLVVLVGSRRALRRAIGNAEVSRRESALAERLASG